MTEGNEPTDRNRRISDSVFLGIVAIITLLVVGVVIFLLRPGDDTSAAPPVSGPGPNQSLPRSSPPLSSPTTKLPGPPRAAAVALVKKYFQLSLSGEFEAACALESPAYAKFDSEHYPGGCVGGARTASKALAAHGLAMHVTGATIVDYSGGSATILTDLKVGARSGSEYVYLTYHAGRWWISGSNDSRDLGY
jgi:hypothetical protein